MLVPFTNFPFLLHSKKSYYITRETKKKTFAVSLLSDKSKVYTRARQERKLTLPGQRKFCEWGDTWVSQDESYSPW